jgi:hypothetical protein
MKKMFEITYYGWVSGDWNVESVDIEASDLIEARKLFIEWVKKRKIRYRGEVSISEKPKK